MSEARGHHFLPRQAYLKFFSTTEGSDQIYLYRRGLKSPVRTNVVNVARERDLYAFEQDGKTNREWETRFFAKIDGDLVPVFSKLNEDPIRSPLRLTKAEMEMLIGFMAYQFLRTPVFKDNRARNNSELCDRARRLSPEQIRQLRRVAPKIPAGVADTDEDFARLWSEAVDQAEPYLVDRRSWLGNMPQFAERIFDELWIKSVTLLTVDGDCFVTCDQPVIVDYNRGFGPSEVLFPVGSHHLLVFDASAKRDVADSSAELRVKRIDATEAGVFNQRILASAEKEAYAALSRDEIQHLLNATVAPDRFAVPDVSDLLGIRAR
jgi:hypothetical protein